MRITKTIHKDGSETITVQIEDVIEVVTIAEWSKMIAGPKIVEKSE
jgi:hypothetical protein